MTGVFRLDLHNHTCHSHDGALSPSRLLALAAARGLACLAVTDHDSLEGGRTCAALASADPSLPRVIPGQEVTSEAGEIIGLYLTDPVPPGLPPLETVAAIHEQGGLVYLPHPCDTMRRSSIRPEVREAVAAAADVVEVRNGRVLRPRFDREAQALAVAFGKPGGAGSDAHYAGEVGRAWVAVGALPTRETLVRLLWDGQMRGRGPLAAGRAWRYQLRTGLRKGARRLGLGRP